MLKRQYFLLITAVTYTIVLLYYSLASISLPLADFDFTNKDKLFHFIAYLLLAILWGLYALSAKNPRALTMSLVLTLVFGIVLESVQQWVNPSRSFDFFDMFANCLGVITGTIVVADFLQHKVKLN